MKNQRNKINIDLFIIYNYFKMVQIFLLRTSIQNKFSYSICTREKYFDHILKLI